MGCCPSSPENDKLEKNDTIPLTGPLGKISSTSSAIDEIPPKFSRPLLEGNNSTFKNVKASDSSSSPIEKELLNQLLNSSTSEEELNQLSESEDEGGISGEMDSSNDDY
ncbi:hypothetical protein TRFO_24122 [Tritrichomonas foetus]|uniref:Uncharacterized protein n=1 Tax=Tritrichomonas foetus TaxID=1144522 RepID=A0A1J4KD50_9EUKA|nr:hypothetical protein TRFO_24122 [Tritrichomonas foetus]|eukprot:OHT07628.1 hypothetical protein TRFO_24122 [Tritrichomonas foetus]